MTERALLCVAGRDAKVKVYNIRDGKAVTVRLAPGPSSNVGEIHERLTLFFLCLSMRAVFCGPWRCKFCT